MRIHVVQHVPFEPPGRIADWAADRGHALSTTQVFAGGEFPPDDVFDALVVMGGPMSVHDEARLAWLTPEKRFIGGAVHAGRPVLGVCLGAQLLADVLGSRVYRNRVREIGWFDVQTTDHARSQAGFGLPPAFGAFHWHTDTFDLPAGAVHLASSAACRNQMFALDGRVLALQFHLEVTPGEVADLRRHCADDLTAGEFVQSREEMLRADFGGTHRLLDDLLDRWTKGVEA